MKLVLCQIQMEPENQVTIRRTVYKTLTISPVFHWLYRAWVVIEAGKLRACSDDIHQVCELVLMLPRCHQTWSVLFDGNSTLNCCFDKTYPGVLIFWSMQTYHCPPRPSHQQIRELTWMANSQTRGSESQICSTLFWKFYQAYLWWTGKNKAIVNMDKMTLTVEKNIAIVPVFNLCNKKQLDFWQVSNGNIVIPGASRRRCSKRRSSLQSSSELWGTLQSWVDQTPGGSIPAETSCCSSWPGEETRCWARALWTHSHWRLQKS